MLKISLRLASYRILNFIFKREYSAVFMNNSINQKSGDRESVKFFNDAAAPGYEGG